MTCEEARLAIEMDEDVDAHVARCDACRAFAAQVSAENALFAAFGASIEPRRDLWLSIGEGLGRDRFGSADATRGLDGGGSLDFARDDTRAGVGWRRGAVAACLAAMVIITAFVMLRGRAPATAPAIAERAAPMPIGNRVVHDAETRYAAAESLLRSELGRTDIELAALDARIAATRAAVVASPDDPVAVARWRAAYDRKIAALRKAVEARS